MTGSDSFQKQLEQYYRCGNEDAAYGYVNPYAVIITGDGMLCLLDINEPENEELLKQMKKKKLRMPFCKERKGSFAEDRTVG